MLASMQYYSTAQWVRYLTFHERPSLFRAVERSLARFPDARSGFVGRMLADPAFVQKTAMEGSIAFVIALAHEVHVRGKRVTQELDFALINAICIAAGAAVCSALVAPSKTPTPPSAKFPWQGMLNKLPNNAFEKNTPARNFEIPQRVSGFLAKGVELSAVNAIAGGASAALQHCLVAARQARNGKYKPATPVPGISRAAGGMGVFGGLAANSRLQAAAGLDRVLLEYAKANTTWQVVGISSAFRAVSQLAIENPWGLGPSAVTSCSRPALQGTPVHHVPTPVRRKGKKRSSKKRKAAAQVQGTLEAASEAVHSAAAGAEAPALPGVPVPA
jgi:Protein RETICULATA-related